MPEETREQRLERLGRSVVEEWADCEYFDPDMDAAVQAFAKGLREDNQPEVQPCPQE